MKLSKRYCCHGARGPTRVILQPRTRRASVAHALQGVVVQVDVGDLDLVLGQASMSTMSRGSGNDFDGPGRQIFHRVVGAVWPNLSFVVRPPGQSQVLMARHMPKMVSCRAGSARPKPIVHGSGSPGPVGKEDAVRVPTRGSSPAGSGREHLQARSQIYRGSAGWRTSAESVDRHRCFFFGDGGGCSPRGQP